MPKIRRKNRATFARTKSELKEELSSGRAKGVKKPLKVRIKKVKRTKKKGAAADSVLPAGKTADQEEEKLIEEAKQLYWQAEREKRIVMWSGVTFFMLLVGFFWIYNIKQVIESNHLENSDSISWLDMTNDMDGKFSQIKEEMAKVKKFAQEADLRNKATSSLKTASQAATTAPAAVLPPAREATSSLFVSEDELTKLREKIEEKAR